VKINEKSLIVMSIIILANERHKSYNY
jgi:hypothetical protein